MANKSLSPLETINGSWIQTIAYLLNTMLEDQITIEELTEALSQELITTAQTEVNLCKVVHLPQDTHLQVTNTLITPTTVFQRAPRVSYSTIYIKPPAKVENIEMRNLHIKNCSGLSGGEYTACKVRTTECYHKVKECKGYVTQADITRTTISKEDCGCSSQPQVTIKQTPVGMKQIQGNSNKWINRSKDNNKCCK